MIELTALILALDEEENIARSLKALIWVPCVILVDGFSKDGTVHIAKSIHPGVTVVQRNFDTHATQWNFGVDQVRTPWVLALDADYELSNNLIEEIKNLNPAEETAAYEVIFEYRVYGRPLRASVYPPRNMLFRHERSRYRDEGHTQILETRGDILRLTGPVYHDDRKPLARWIRSQVKYSEIEAKHLLSISMGELNFQDRVRRRIFIAAPVMFFYLLFGRGLIFDGWPGWFYVCQRTIAELLLSLRLLIESNQLEETRER
jgi:glycosyltransferase involved in cell wall biosynthesis